MLSYTNYLARFSVSSFVYNMIPSRVRRDAGRGDDYNRDVTYLMCLISSHHICSVSGCAMCCFNRVYSNYEINSIGMESDWEWNELEWMDDIFSRSY